MKNIILFYFISIAAMEEAKQIISESFYTQPLMFLSALVAFIFGVSYRNKFQELKFIFFYPFASIIQMVSFYFTIFTESDTKHWSLEKVAESMFVLIEFLIFYNFFYKVIIIKNLRRFVQVIFIIFILYVLFMWTCTNTFRKNPFRIYLPQSLCILCFCFLYFFQLFKLPPKLNLLNIPGFWITIGCLFYFSCTIPLFFLQSILDPFPHYQSFYSINFLAYAVLFLLISKSFLCNPPLTK